ncbi:hypothetical protein C1646_704772 [Rhizophagus diaphanus]|nr:hypothetical protein C1646_704772 [Rhizophagus diaphanus] [Rhizophagus sp. MUCL 43196]
MSSRKTAEKITEVLANEVRRQTPSHVVEAVVKNASEIPEVAEKVVTEIAENVTSGAPDGRPIVYR